MVSEYVAGLSINQLLAQLLPGAAKNISHINDPKVVELVQKQFSILDPKERKKVLDELQIYFVSQGYRPFYPAQLGSTGHHPWLKNYKYRWPLEIYGAEGRELEVTWIDKG